MVVRGRKPDRNLEAALAGFLIRGVEAWVGGKPRPWVYGLVGAVEHGSAQNPHRIRDRAAAFRSNQRVANSAVELLDSAIPLVDRLVEANEYARSGGKRFITNGE